MLPSPGVTPCTCQEPNLVEELCRSSLLEPGNYLPTSLSRELL